MKAPLLGPYLQADSLFGAMAEPENRRFVATVLGALTEDPKWTPYILEQVTTGAVELRGALAWLARELQPKSYLEIGVRRGLSMAMVAARCKHVAMYGFDLWIPDYAGVPNPGPSFVESELRRVGYTGRVRFIDGDTHRTLPAFFGHRRASAFDRMRLRARRRERPAAFDLITVDGDHSLIGAYQDLHDVIPHCVVGGAVVFDDIAPDLTRVSQSALMAERGPDPRGWGDLLGVWRAVGQEFPNFRFFEYTHHPQGVGVAVRLA